MHIQKNSKCIYIFLLLSLLLTVSASAKSATTDDAKPKPLTLGLLPYLNLKPLVKKWSPLIKYLEIKLQRPITITSAKNFKTFIARANNQEYDIYYTAPHFAALAEKQKIYERLVGFDKKLHGDVIVYKDSPYQTIQDLKNKKIVTPDRLAIITLIGEKFLLQHGLILNKSIYIRYLKSHSSAMYAVALQQADAAIVAGGMIKRTPATISRHLRLLTITEDIPHTMLMLKSSLSVINKNRIKTAFADFDKNKKYSEPFYKNVGFGRFQKIPDKDMNYFDTIIPAMLKRIEQKK